MPEIAAWCLLQEPPPGKPLVQVPLDYARCFKRQEIPCGSGLTAPGLLVSGAATKPLLVTSTLTPGSPALGSPRTLLNELCSHHRLGQRGSWCGPERGALLVPS